MRPLRYKTESFPLSTDLMTNLGRGPLLAASPRSGEGPFPIFLIGQVQADLLSVLITNLPLICNFRKTFFSPVPSIENDEARTSPNFGKPTVQEGERASLLSDGSPPSFSFPLTL